VRRGLEGGAQGGANRRQGALELKRPLLPARRASLVRALITLVHAPGNPPLFEHSKVCCLAADLLAHRWKHGVDCGGLLEWRPLRDLLLLVVPCPPPKMHKAGMFISTWPWSCHYGTAGERKIGAGSDLRSRNSARDHQRSYHQVNKQQQRKSRTTASHVPPFLA